MPFELVEGSGPIVATAIHAGHRVRPGTEAELALDADARLHEEDPYTDQIARVVATHLVVTHSRFEVDLNRPRETAIYRTPADAWGLEVWKTQPSTTLLAESLAEYDRFYAALDRLLRTRVELHGRLLVLDIHSYNHMREGGEPADPVHNPEINIGTGSLERDYWGSVVDAFSRALRAAGPFDVRENVKFRGGEMSKWIHRTFPRACCCLALEFKKTFMDETTGAVDALHLARICRAVESCLPFAEAALR